MPRLINNLLKNLRLKYRPDLTQAAAAEHLGLQKSHMNKLEKGGIGRLSEGLLVKLEEVYRFGPHWREALAQIPVIDDGFGEDGPTTSSETDSPPKKYSSLLAALPCYGIRVWWWLAPACFKSGGPDSFKRDPATFLPRGPEPMLIPEWGLVFGRLKMNMVKFSMKVRFLTNPTAGLVIPTDAASGVRDDEVLYDDVLLVRRGRDTVSATAEESRLSDFRRRYKKMKRAAYSIHELPAVLKKCKTVVRALGRRVDIKQQRGGGASVPSEDE